MGIRVFQQKITAGHDFNGVAPTTTPAPGTEIEKAWPTDIVGGLFDFALAAPGELAQVELVLGGQSSWKLVKVDHESLETTIFSGTNETNYFSPMDKRVIVLAGQKLKLTTVGASGALTARLYVRDSTS